MTVVALASGWLVQTWWRQGAGDKPVEKLSERELASADLAGFPEALEKAGAWALAALPIVASGEGTLEIDHEAYEYVDNDPDSLDLDAWRPPRHWRIEHGVPGELPAQARELLGSYRRFLPDELKAGGASALASAFPG